MMLPNDLIADLETALDDTLAPEVPGAAVAILSPDGDWFGASGVSDLANNTPLQPNDRFEAGSITKTFIATTILQLVEEEQLSLEETLTDWLPITLTDLVPNANEIKIEQLLAHTSGIVDYVDLLFQQAATNPTLFLQEWQPEQLVSFIDGRESLFNPGQSWQYSNTNYILAGLVIESVTGNSYASEIRDRLLDPLNLQDTFIAGEEEIPEGYIKGYWDFDGNGSLDDLSIANLSWAGSAGSLISNTADLATFFDGLLKERTLLQPETLEKMLDTIPVNSPNYDSYGLGIGTLESPTRFWYAHRGQTLGFRSNLWYSPAEDITYVELINGRSEDNLVRDLLPTFRNGLENNHGENTTMVQREGYQPGDSFDFVTPSPTYEGELTPGEQANADFVDLLGGEALLNDLQAGGYVIYIRHAQTERDFADQVSADVDDFSTQRVLSEFGIQQSLVIGEGFNLSEIPYDDVITSDYGRSIKTAAIAFGEYQKDSALNFLPFEDYTPEQIEEMRENVTPFLSAVPEAGTNTVIVGHDDLFEAGTGIYPDPQGIAYLLKPDGQGDFEIIANLLPEEWVELSQPDQSFLMIPDSVSDRILLFNPFDGSLVNDNFIDGSETGLGIFETPINAIQVNQEIWVSDQVADAIFRFDLSGNYLGIVSDADGDGDTDGLDNIRGIEFVDNLIYVANAGDENDAPGDGKVVVVFDTAGNNLGFFDTGDPYDIRAYNGELLVTDINSNDDGGEDIDRYTLDGINSTLIDTFHESDGETGLNFPQQVTLRESTGTVLVGGFSNPGGVYEYDINGDQVGFFGAEEGFADRLRAGYELGNGNIIWSGGDGMIVTNPSTGEDVDIYTVNNQDFRPSARYIEPLVILGDRDLTGAVYVADQTLDTLLLTQDLTGDGDANDPLETSVFFDGTNESGLVEPTANIFTVLQASDGSVFYGDGDTDTVYRLTDNNRDGDALDAGEAGVWFSAENTEGLPLLTPNGLAIGPDQAIYITEADTVSTPNGDFIYRTEDLNGDGDANDAGEASIWLDLKAVNPNSSAFEISFIGDTAYIIDSVGGDPNVIYRAQDLDGNGTVETEEVSVLVDETMVPVDFALTTDGESLFSVELLDFEEPQSVFKIEDGDTVTITEVWNSTAVPDGYVLSAAFSIAANPDGELVVTSNGGDPNEDNVFRLVDQNGDGDYFDEGETIPYLSQLLTSTVPVRPRVVEYAQNPDGMETSIPVEPDQADPIPTESGEDVEGWSLGDSSDFVTPPPTYEGELTPGEQANADFVDQLEGAELLSALQDGGYVIYIRHAITERDFADQVTADVNDFSTQRVVSELGVQQSLTIGEGFEFSEIPYGEVITSDYARAVETAAIAFEEYQKDSALNFLPFEDYTPEQIEEMRENVTPFLSAVPEAGTNTVIVGHDDLFEAGTGIYPDPQGIAYILEPDGNGDFNIIANLLPEEWIELSQETSEPIDEVTFNFDWTGQIAGFSIEGNFSYDAGQTYEDGIVREENLTDFDVSFFDPDGNLLRTYEDNHLTFSEFNFAFDTETQEILQDGYLLGPEGINIGEKTPTDDGFSGLNFWSRPEFNSQGEVPPPHVHVDDWADEFGFPIGFSSHEDVGFFTRTTQELLDTGRVGETYVDNTEADLDALGERVQVFQEAIPATPSFGSLEDDTLESSLDFEEGGFVFAGAGNDLVDNTIGADSRIYGGSGSNELFGGTRDRLFGGDEADIIDTVAGGGFNRIYAGNGNDDLFLGSNDRALGGDGSDRFFLLGSDTTVTGGAGADQFWIANGDFPEAVNIVTDFISGEDVVGIAGIGISDFSELTIVGEENAIVSAAGNDLAELIGIAANELSADDFALV